MSRHRLITIVALFALAACCASAPAAGASSTLLSGYGGPGQGNQAILGSTLIGGGSSGGSGGSGGGQAPAAQAAPSSIEASSASSTAGKGTGGASGSRSAAHKAPGGPIHHGAAATPAGAGTIARAEDARSVSAPALGLGGKDIALIVLAFAVLALTAFVTVLLTRRPSAEGTGRGAIGSD
ncbi:MAG TPA: hypothetical protein VNV44_06290 [Solirubrobacteraceae bacterium]|jgi:hypothetical protein|nr:hypothetical protein [Solirubrobacteraceae bacterium]